MEELAQGTPFLLTRVGRLGVRGFTDRLAMGEAAGRAVLSHLRRLLSEQSRVRVVFAAAPSQNEMLETLSAADDVDWARVEALQMDEYVGRPRGSSQSFGRYLDERLFARVHPGAVHQLDGSADPQAEAARYGALLEEKGIDLCCMGIGENGHIAFNEPGDADFADPEWVKAVELESASRLQQVRDGCFASVDEVPRQALTLTVPALIAAAHIICTVPGRSKREAVKRTLRDPIGPACPASALRAHPDAILFVDRDAWPEEAG